MVLEVMVCSQCGQSHLDLLRAMQVCLTLPPCKGEGTLVTGILTGLGSSNVCSLVSLKGRALTMMYLDSPPAGNRIYSAHACITLGEIQETAVLSLENDTEVDKH
eukprot:6141622-Amphidinium_carterae.1